MMQRFFLQFIVFLFANNLYAQKNLFIKLNPRDCSNCFVALEDLSSIHKSVNKHIILPEINNEELLYFKEKINDNSVNFVLSDSAYESIDKINSSTISYYVSGKLKFNIPLKNYEKFKSQLLNSDTVYFKNRLSKDYISTFNNGKFSIFNPITSNIQIYDIQNPINPEIEYKLDSVTIYNCFKSFFNDDKQYSDFYLSGFSKKIGRLVRLSEIRGFNYMNDTAYIITKNSYVKNCKYQGKADSCIMYFLTLHKVYRTIEGQKQIILPIRSERDEIIDFDRDFEYPDIDGRNIYFHNGLVYINLTQNKIKSKKKDRFIALLVLNKSGYEIDRVLEIPLPELLYKHPFGFVNDYTIKYPYVMHKFSNEIYNLERKEYIKLPIKLPNIEYLKTVKSNPANPIKINFSVSNIFYDEARIRLIVNRDGNAYCVTLNRDKFTFVSEELVYSNKEGELRTEIHFENINTLIISPKTCNCIVRVYLDN